MASADEMLANAAAASDAFAMPGVSSKPARHVAVLTCMDVRIDPLPLLGLQRGDAHVIRNAGGLVTDDALRSLSASQRLLGTEEVVVIMHERCGLCGASDEEFAALLAADGAQPVWRLGGFEELEHALRDGIERLRQSKELPRRDAIRGLIFDPESGSLREPGRDGDRRPADGEARLREPGRDGDRRPADGEARHRAPEGEAARREPAGP